MFQMNSQKKRHFSKMIIIYSSEKVTIHTTRKHYEFHSLTSAEQDTSRPKQFFIHKKHPVPKLDFILHLVTENKRLLSAILWRHLWRCSETSFFTNFCLQLWLWNEGMAQYEVNLEFHNLINKEIINTKFEEGGKKKEGSTISDQSTRVTYA